jgi:transposase
MAYREVTMLEVKEVLRLWLRGRALRAIARSVGVTRNTVRSYVETAVACGLAVEGGEQALSEERLGEVLLRLKMRPERGKGESWGRCESEREFIEGLLRQRVRLSKVRRLLERRGVSVPYVTLHRFATSELGFGAGSATVAVADGEPGEELQVDTGVMGYLEPGGGAPRRRFKAWVFQAVRSRYRFVYPCVRETTESAIEACEAAWAFFGGVFRVLVPDNTKAIVARYDPLEPHLTPAFLEYAQARGFEVDPTRRRSPRDKGRVERSVALTRDDCFAGEVLVDLEAARRRAEWWCRNEHGMRRHTRTQRLPLEQFEAEELGALAAPPTAPYDPPQWGEAKVPRDQYAQVQRALYSLPREFEGRTLRGLRLRTRSDRYLVRFYLDGVLVKTHPRQPAGGRSTDVADFPPEALAYARRDVEFLANEAAKHGESVGAFARALLAGRLPWTRMRQVYALMGLCRRLGSERVEQACAQALSVDLVDVRRLARMLEGGRPKNSAPGHTATVVPLGRYLRPARDYLLAPTGGIRTPQEER